MRTLTLVFQQMMEDHWTCNTPCGVVSIGLCAGKHSVYFNSTLVRRDCADTVAEAQDIAQDYFELMILKCLR